jgi:hypothetical protein
MKPITGLALGAVCTIVVACAAGSKSAVPPEPPSAAGGTPDMSRGAEHQEIDRLDQEIDAALAKGKMPAVAAPRCGANCAASAAEPMGAEALLPTAEDTSCHPANSATCTDSCTLKDSICKNAGKICDLAKQLGGTDGYANEKCVKGKASCQTAHDYCCNCQL